MLRLPDGHIRRDWRTGQAIRFPNNKALGYAPKAPGKNGANADGSQRPGPGRA